MRDPTAWVATLVIAVLGSGPGARPVAKLPVSGSAGLPYPPANLSRTLDGPKTGLWLNGSESFVLFYGLDSFMVQGPSVAPTTSLHGSVAQLVEATVTRPVFPGFDSDKVASFLTMALGSRLSALGFRRLGDGGDILLHPESFVSTYYHHGHAEPNCSALLDRSFIDGMWMLKLCMPSYQSLSQVFALGLYSLVAMGQHGPMDHVGVAAPRGAALALLYHAVRAEAVCIHCRDSIPGCAGGDACPLVSELATNTAIFAEARLGSTPRLAHFLPAELCTYFPRSICEAIVGIACAPAVGQEINFEHSTYATSQSVVQAALYGHCSVLEASSVLTARLESADNDVEVNKIKGALDSLKIVSDRIVTSSQGVMSYLWAKVSNIVNKRASGTTRLVTSTSKPSTSDLTATLVRPATEEAFFEMIHYFTMVILALGIASPTILFKFMDDVVWGALRMKESWKCAHELFLLYAREIDTDSTRTVHMGNVFRRGGQDTLLTEARRNAEAFFRTLGGNPSGDESSKRSVKPNGRYDSTSTKACVDFNLGRPCKKLKDDGTCMFNHRCNQFVSDKGAGGMCFGTHARCNGCDYDNDKKVSRPATQ
jgi:hypothetical protein